MVQRTNLWGYQPGGARPFLKITCALPNLVTSCRSKQPAAVGSGGYLVLQCCSRCKRLNWPCQVGRMSPGIQPMQAVVSSCWYNCYQSVHSAIAVECQRCPQTSSPQLFCSCCMQVLLRMVCQLVVASIALAAMRATCCMHCASWWTQPWGEDSGWRYLQVGQTGTRGGS